ncbi:MAG: WYL domain-containing protein [Clostridia bacterium]|nr:WYL domain-containing protein [Clostridia bacterium]
MKSAKPKKLLIMNILDILRRYTDAEHRLSQKDIVEILKSEYDMVADRKSIKRNIQSLIEFGYDINFSEALRMIPNKDGELEESYILSDFYLERDFSDSELRLLIDGLLFSKHIPYSQCKELVGKLEGLSNQYFKSRVRYIKTLPDNSPNNRQLFYTIEILDEAISKGKQVSFNYNHFETDKKMHPAMNDDGSVKEYIINPYQIAATNGRYYLICNYDKYDNVSNYRLDRVTNIKLLDTSVKPQNKVKGLENGFNLPKHMAEHLYMFSGDSIPVTFTAKKYLLNDLLDWFGKDITFTDETEDDITVRVTVNEQAMRRWAMQYALHIKILSPASLAEQMKKDLTAALKQYE